MATQIASEPLLVTVEDAARMLAVHRSKIFPLLMSQRIKSLKIGRSRRIPMDSLRQFIAEELAAQHDDHFSAAS
jgi:excisionase family DNA binding protein